MIWYLYLNFVTSIHIKFYNTLKYLTAPTTQQQRVQIAYILISLVVLVALLIKRSVNDLSAFCTLKLHLISDKTLPSNYACTFTYT